jgi:hypothetical protein
VRLSTASVTPGDPLGEGGQGPRQDADLRGLGASDRQHTGFAPPRQPGHPGRPFDVSEDPPRFRQERPAGIGELYLSRGAQQKLHLDLFLQLADLLTERRLRDVEPLGRATEVELIGQRHEIAEVPKLHVPLISYTD